MDVGIIDRFFETFNRYIDSGFGLLEGDIAYLTAILIGIDIALAGLAWAMTANGAEEVIMRLIKKTLYIGAFAYIIGNFSTLANILFHSFAGLGLTAGGSTLTEADLLRPGHVAITGLDAARPLITQMGALVGPVDFFFNFKEILVLAIAWLFVLLAFFILAVQMFVTLIEFKLTTLAGFVLIPFALWGKTAFLAEKVLGNVVSSGIKVLVLAVIVGIGTGIFAEFIVPPGEAFTMDDALATLLGALALLGLGFFGPGIASGLVSGAPQLGAGAAASTTMAGAGVVAGAALGAAGGARLAAGAAVKGTRMAASAGSAFKAGVVQSGTIGAASLAPGVAGVARAAGQGIAHRVRERFKAGAGSSSIGSSASGRSRSASGVVSGAMHAARAMRAGDRGGSSAGPSLSKGQ